MKMTRSSIIVLSVFLTTQAALAWYDPSTQRWLSRDPMDEPGFETLRAATQVMAQSNSSIISTSSRWINRDPVKETRNVNLYEFGSNNPIDEIDPLGLSPSCNKDDYDTCAKKCRLKYYLDMAECTLGYLGWVIQYDERFPVFGIGFAAHTYKLCTDKALDNFSKCLANCNK